MATIKVQPNIGGWDHAYAYYITTILPERVKAGEENGSVAIFLKSDSIGGRTMTSGLDRHVESVQKDKANGDILNPEIVISMNGTKPFGPRLCSTFFGPYHTQRVNAVSAFWHHRSHIFTVTLDLVF